MRSILNMEKKRTNYTSDNSNPRKIIQNAKEAKKKTQGACEISQSSSHTQFLRVPKHESEFKRITRDEYFNVSESVSESLDAFHCVQGKKGSLKTKLNPLDLGKFC